MEKYHCHKCSKDVARGEFLCDNCYKKSDHHFLFNFFGFCFGLTTPILAILAIAYSKCSKAEFYRWSKIGLIIPVAGALVDLLNRILGIF